MVLPFLWIAVFRKQKKGVLLKLLDRKLKEIWNCFGDRGMRVLYFQYLGRG